MPFDAAYAEMFPLAHDETPYRKLPGDFVKVEKFGDKEMIVVDPKGIELLTYEAFKDINHLLRPGHLALMRKIMDDPEASPNDKFVALELLKNAVITSYSIHYTKLYEIADVEEEVLGLGDAPEHRIIGIDDVLVGGEHLALVGRALLRLAVTALGVVERLRADVDLADVGHRNRGDVADRRREPVVQAGLGGFDELAEQQFDTLFVGLNLVEAGTRPGGDQHREAEDDRLRPLRSYNFV